MHGSISAGWYTHVGLQHPSTQCRAHWWQQGGDKLPSVPANATGTCWPWLPQHSALGPWKPRGKQGHPKYPGEFSTSWHLLQPAGATLWSLNASEYWHPPTPAFITEGGEHVSLSWKLLLHLKLN